MTAWPKCTGFHRHTTPIFLATFFDLPIRAGNFLAEVDGGMNSRGASELIVIRQSTKPRAQKRGQKRSENGRN